MSREIESGSEAGVLHHEVTGEGRPIVYIGGQADSISPAASLLGENYTVFVPAWWEPAENGSGKREETADRIAAFIENVVGEDACDVVGHGEGAEVALWLAARHPKRVAKLILLAANDIRATPSASDDLIGRLAKVEARTLIIYGTGDGAVGPKVGPFLKKHLPVSHLTYVYDAAGAVESDQPARFQHLANAFLERGAAFAVNPGKRRTHVI